MATFLERNRTGQAGKPDNLSSGAFLSCVMTGVVSPGVGMIDVSRPILPSGASCYGVFDMSVTEPIREAALSDCL